MKALDTETQDGYAVWIGSITDAYEFREVEPKAWPQIIAFLCQEKEYVAWNSDYDVQAILKWLPRVYLERIVTTGSCHYGNIAIRYVANKFCKFWHTEISSDHRKLFCTIYDLRQFYACSLDSAAKRLHLPRKGAIPKSWYKHMGDRLNDPKTRQKVLDYARQDVLVLQRILEKTQVSFTRAGLEFVRPVSCASFAERSFSAELATGRAPRYVQQTARLAYYGGHIECLRAGFFARAWNSDIHSAYPSEIAALISCDGKWRSDLRIVRPDAKYAFVHCVLDIPEDSYIGPVPVRSRLGYIYYPVGKFRTWLTLSEFIYCEKWITKILRIVQMIGGSGERPFFAKVHAMYKQRQENPQASYAIKIILNALYGKTAQKRSIMKPTRYVDSRATFMNDQFFTKGEQWSKHTSFVYASEVTARIRMKLLEETPLDKVIFFATDAAMTIEPCRMANTGPGLGQWSEPEEIHNLCVIGAGVYQYEYWNEEQEHVRRTKFRGFDVRFGEFTPLLARAGNRHSVSFKVTRNTSMKQSVDPTDFNVLRDVSRHMNVNFDRKRQWPKRWSAAELLDNQFTSQPWLYTPTFYISSSKLEEPEE